MARNEKKGKGGRSDPGRRGMSGYDLLLRKVVANAEEMRKLQTLAVAQYTPVVDAIIATRCHDTSHIETYARPPA